MWLSQFWSSPLIGWLRFLGMLSWALGYSTCILPLSYNKSSPVPTGGPFGLVDALSKYWACRCDDVQVEGVQCVVSRLWALVVIPPAPAADKWCGRTNNVCHFSVAPSPASPAQPSPSLGTRRIVAENTLLIISWPRLMLNWWWNWQSLYYNVNFKISLLLSTLLFSCPQ